nr:penicillin acylase family protein [Natranaeroarchaeum aerophilus]
MSGDAWDAADRSLPGSVESPYGDASLHVDEFGVPHVEAEEETAAYFAVGYVQAFDRLFQLDLQRRVMRGQLSEVIGEATIEDDEFHVRMDFAGAAEATWELVSETRAGPLVEAYADGVNTVIEEGRLPLEFELLGYEPRPWTPVDSMLMEKQISWDLTGDFSELRRALLADRLDDELVETLFPRRLDHEYPILGGGAVDGDAMAQLGTHESPDTPSRSEPLDAELTRYLSAFESPRGVGSNSWVVSGEYTESGDPILAYDPHLSLMTPPLWYEQHVETPERSVRGATFPGVPFVIAGANDRGAWSFTNVGADVLDCYRYDIDEDGDRYRYRDEWREFEREEHTIGVAGGEDRTLTRRKTVHGPLIEREDRRVGVAWTGHTATRTTVAIEAFGRSDGLDDVRAATREFDLPTQNLVYADADGRTMYYVTGKLPIRQVDGEVVTGDRIFDGSAGEGEWDGFEPFGQSSWDGFVPFEEKPHAIDPDVLATANQRVVDDPDHYIGVSYATPYRGMRIEERLADAVGDTDPEFHRELQNDVLDGRAAQLAPDLVAAVQEDDEGAATDRIVDAASSLDEWEYRMEPESEAALVFARWFTAFRRRLVEPTFEDADLDESYYPNDWVIATLPADHSLFEDRSRESMMVDALGDALDEIDEEGWSVYGDWNSTRSITHPLGVEAGFLDYRTRPADGSRATVKNFRVESAVGSSWRMVVRPGEAATAILPGGNSGDYFSPHYDDQFERWLANDQKSMELAVAGEQRTQFRGESS